MSILDFSLRFWISPETA